MNTYVFQDDDMARELMNLAKKRNMEVVLLKDPDEIDCTKKFIVLNSDNGNHHRTLQILKKCSQIDGCFLIDDHDDITLGQLEFESTGQANWVEHVLKLNLCKMVFVGQRYWAWHLTFRSSSYIGLFRNNLHRYRPISSIYFVCFMEKNTLLCCDKRTFAEIISYFEHIQDAENIERVFILNEEVASIKEKMRKDKVDIYTRDELLWKEQSKPFENLYPVFLVKWKEVPINKLPLENVYISIDLDVLLKTSRICSIIKQIGRSFNIVGADIYGYGVDWLQKTDEIYEALIKTVLM